MEAQLLNPQPFPALTSPPGSCWPDWEQGLRVAKAKGLSQVGKFQQGIRELPH